MLSGTNFHDFNEAHIEKVPVKNGGYFIHADTLKMEYNDVRFRSSSVVALSTIRGQAKPSGMIGWAEPWAFGQCCFYVQQFQLYLQVTPVAPFLDTTSGNYTVRATAKVTSVPSHAGIANEFIRFQAVNGRVTAPPSGLWATNGQGQAVTDITGNEKNQPLQIIASCHTATVKYEARLETLSAGHVSKIGRLQGLNIPEISAYHLPI